MAKESKFQIENVDFYADLLAETMGNEKGNELNSFTYY